MATVDVFADAGLMAFQEGVLPDAIAELAIRLDLAGAGPLLDELMALCFARYDDRGVCPVCGGKQPPGKPHPKPPKPPPPPKPQGQAS